MQRDAATHEQAVRDYQAYVEDTQTRKEREAIVQEQLGRNPFLEAKPGGATVGAVEGGTGVTVWIVTAVLVAALMGAWWALTRRQAMAGFEKPQPTPGTRGPRRPPRDGARPPRQ